MNRGTDFPFKSYDLDGTRSFVSGKEKINVVKKEKNNKWEVT